MLNPFRKFSLNPDQNIIQMILPTLRSYPKLLTPWLDMKSKQILNKKFLREILNKRFDFKFMVS